MKWLLLDTACPRAMVAIVKDEKIAAEVYLEETFKHGEKLAGAITACLAKADLEIKQIDGVAVGRGPGSFVGVRVAIAHAKGLCVALQIPLVGICTLSALAASFDFQGSVQGFAYLDARRSEFYVKRVKIAQRKLISLASSTVLAAEKAEELGIKSHMGGFIAQTEGDKVYEAPGVKAQGMLLLLNQALNEAVEVENEVFSLTPAYVRGPDAKPPSFIS